MRLAHVLPRLGGIPSTAPHPLGTNRGPGLRNRLGQHIRVKPKLPGQPGSGDRWIIREPCHVIQPNQFYW